MTIGIWQTLQYRNKFIWLIMRQRSVVWEQRLYQVNYVNMHSRYNATLFLRGRSISQWFLKWFQYEMYKCFFLESKYVAPIHFIPHSLLSHMTQYEIV